MGIVRTNTRKQSASHTDHLELVRSRVRAQLELEFPLHEIAALASKDPEKIRKELTRILFSITNRVPCKIEDSKIRSQVIEDIRAQLLGYGLIDELLKNPEVSEVMVNSTNSIYFEREGKLYRHTASYENEEELRSLIDRIVAPLGRRIDESSPLVNGRLPEGHRVHAIIPPLAIDGPTLTVRKFRNRVYSLGELSDMGAIPPKMALFLKWMVLLRKNIAISGGTGSGKTTFLNALSLVIPFQERIITIEDSAELKFHRHPHVVRLESRASSIEGTGEISIRDLVITSLRMRPDRIVVGEVRGAESLEMLQAMNTGHDGSMTTLHANSATEVITRLVTMVGYGARLSEEQILSQIASAFQLIIHLERQTDGSRKVQTMSLLERGGSLRGEYTRGSQSRFSLRTIMAYSGGNRWTLSIPQNLIDEIAQQEIASKEELQQWLAL